MNDATPLPARDRDLPAAQARAAANCARAAYHHATEVANDADVGREYVEAARSPADWDRAVRQLETAKREATQLLAALENALKAARAAHRLALES